MDNKKDDINIKTLALKLGLSPGSVSKALKDSHEISETTKKKVRQLAFELNYVPNPYASSLRKRKSKTIAVVVPEVADSFFSLAINGIEAVAQTKGYHVIISLTNELLAKERKIIRELKSGRVDGILMSVSRETTEGGHIKELQTKGIPVVFFDRATEDIDTAKVITNDEESGYMACKHLIESGCKNINFLSISKCLAISSRRQEGFKRALLESGLQFGQANVTFCSTDKKENFALIADLLSADDKPDGIVASVEMLSIVVYNVCGELQLKIPSDVKLVGFSNLSCASVLNPALTTITQPAFEMGQAAALLLCKALEKKNTLLNEVTVISSSLNVRESSGKSVLANNT